MKNFSPLVMFLVCSYVAFAQTPEKMSYQAIVRDANNTLLVDKLVGIQVSILQNSETGLEVYIETHSVVTNMNGLVALEIGMGVTSYDFSSIDWTNGPYFVKVETDPNGADNYSISGVSQLMSVPYSLYAKASGNGITTSQADAIVTNTAKTGITSDQADAIVANTAKTGITSDQSDAIVANTAKTGITSDQSDAIVANTAKTGITSDQSDAIVANTSKTGITSDQADAIVANTTKTGITSDQSDAIVTNTAKTSITSDQSDAIVANTAKTSITTDQTDAIVVNTAKISLPSGGNEDDILKIINGEYVWVGEPTYQLNTFYSKLGGYVIDINSDGTHGLVVAMQDQGFGNWYDATNKINDPDNHDSDGGKFRDWRLPSKRELILIYQVYLNSNPLDLLSTTYWSSTEFNYLKAWCHVISSNSKYYDSKYGATFDIRAVRSF